MSKTVSIQLSEEIPQSSHVTDTVIVTESGEFQRTWKVAGVAFDTVGLDELNNLKRHLNSVLLGIGDSNVSIWHHQHHRPVVNNLPKFGGGYASEYNDRYAETLNSIDAFVDDHYLTVIFRPVKSKIVKSIITAGRRSREQILKDRENSIRRLDEISMDIESSMGAYGFQPLGIYESEDGVVMSSALSFLNLLTSGEWQEVEVTNTPISSAIGSGNIIPGARAVAIENGDDIRYAKSIEFMNYAPSTHPGMMSELLYMPFQFIITQSFSVLDRYDGIKALKRQKGRLVSSEDSSVDQVDSLVYAVRNVKNGVYCMGEYHITFMAFGKSIDDVTKNASDIMSVMKNKGVICKLSGLATKSALLSQIPCNWFHRPRVAWITSRNFASLASMHNFPLGKASLNPWGNPLTIFDTPSAHPYNFSLHATADDGEDYTDKRRLASTVIIGQSGTGKSVLLNHLYLQSLRYGYSAKYSCVTFDIDQAAKATIEAVGGQYLSLEKGQPTGFNPFQVEENAENVQFLIGFVKSLVGGDISTPDESRITRAISTLMKFPMKKRRLSVLLQNLTSGTSQHEREYSLQKRLAKWCVDDGKGNRGELHWVFDCENDQIDLTTHDQYGFDGTAFLDDSEINTPVIMYLIHRIQSMIDGRRFILWIDEAFRYLGNDQVMKFLGDKLPTIRKANGLVVMATQSPETILKSEISRAMVEQSATKVFLPNRDGKRSDYIDGFSLTDTEYDIINGLAEDSRTFLVKQLGTSVQARLNLNGMDSDLHILASSGRFDK